MGRMASFLTAVGLMNDAVDKKAGARKYIKHRNYSRYTPGLNPHNVLASKGVRPRRRRSARRRGLENACIA